VTTTKYFVQNSWGDNGNDSELSEVIDGVMLRWKNGKVMMAMMASEVLHA
jgi:hypothetical protein